MARSLMFLSLGFGFAAISGCGSRPEIAPVRGTVVQAGRPLNGVMVTFMPDPQQGTDGAVSTAITDDLGQFELLYRGDERVKGALVGHHRVVVKDVAMENTRDESARPLNRVPQKYGLAAETPLAYQISMQPQTIDIELGEP